MISDDDHRIWVSHSRGLSRIEVGYDAGGRVTEVLSIENYGKQDGTGSNAYKVRAVQRDGEGNLLFGGNEALTVFDPAHIRTNTRPPEVYLTDLQIGYRPVRIESDGSPPQGGSEQFSVVKHIQYLDVLELTQEQKTITFEFVALNYMQPEKIRYAFMLEGFDDDWNFVGGRREATYTRLAPGQYTFRVKAANSDGYWNEEGARIDVIVHGGGGNTE